MPIKKGTVEVEKIYRVDFHYLYPYLAWYGGSSTKEELLSSLDWNKNPQGSIFNSLNWHNQLPSDLTEVNFINYNGVQVYPTTYIVSFKTFWDDQVVSTQTVNRGSSATFPNVSYGTGYQSNGYTGEYTNITSNRTIIINRKPIEYTLTIGSVVGVVGITIKRGNNTLQNNSIIYHHEKLTISASPDIGYNSPNITSPVTVSGNLTASSYITAGSLKTYTVTWKDWDGTIIKTELVSHGSNGTHPSDPSRTGYTFSSWSNNPNNVQSERTIVAEYSINYYTIKWYNYEGNVFNTDTLAYGTLLKYTPGPSRTGYNFTGWDYEEGHVVTSNIDNYPYYTIKTYKLTIGSKAGIASIIVKRGSTTLSNGATISHFDSLVISGTAETGYNSPTGSTITVSGNVTASNHITAGSLKTYTVKWYNHDGSIYYQDTISHGSKLQYTPGPSRTGYNFTGWDYEEGHVVTSNIDNYPYYTIKTYTVRFITEWNNEVISNQTINHGSNASFPNVSYGSGYESNGYTGSYTNVTSNRDIIIKRKTSQLTVTYSEMTYIYPEMNSFIIYFNRTGNVDSKIYSGTSQVASANNITRSYISSGDYSYYVTVFWNARVTIYDRETGFTIFDKNLNQFDDVTESTS